jgi:energy-coupling factor transport system substrate-specific component
MEALPNIHLLALLIIVLTVVFRSKTLIAIYVFVFLNGFFNGFNDWWIPYLYIWTVLWLVVMLLPDFENKNVATVVYCVIAGLHGLLFGTMFAPVQAFVYGLDFKGTITWILAGLPFDVTHMIGNILSTLLAVPLITVLKKAIR